MITAFSQSAASLNNNTHEYPMSRFKTSLALRNNNPSPQLQHWTLCCQPVIFSNIFSDHVLVYLCYQSEENYQESPWDYCLQAGVRSTFWWPSKERDWAKVEDECLVGTRGLTKRNCAVAADKSFCMASKVFIYCKTIFLVNCLTLRLVQTFHVFTRLDLM